MPRPRVTVELDREGVAEVLHSPEVRQMVNEAADKIAAHVQGEIPEDVPVEVRAYSTDREAATVAVPDRRAMGWQARDGILTRAASSIGAEVKEHRS